MTHPHVHKHHPRSFPGRKAALLGALIAFGLLAATPASAAYEQVGCFAGSLSGLTESCKPVSGENFSEEVQLGGVSGMTVNSSGAGGVPPGTVYALSYTITAGPWVTVFEPQPDGSLAFVQAWQVTTLEEGYKRCGPLLGTSCTPMVKAQTHEFDIDVDQSTGNVYVLNGEAFFTGTKMVIEYKPDGSEVITRFAEFELGTPSNPTSASPSKVHESSFYGGLAVDGAGNAYVFDLNTSDNFYHRLMTFEPCTPGDVTSYCYAGQNHDIAAGFQGETKFPTHPAVDAAGNIYTLSGENTIQKYDLGQSLSTPMCSFEFAKAGIYSMAVKPDGGVFFFSYKKEAGFQTKLVHQLSPCQGGKFQEIGKFEVEPERDDIKAMAFDPARQISGRGVGVLYGGAAGPEPGVGKGEPGQAGLGYIFAPLEEGNPPEIESEAVSGVTAASAQLRAVINPKNLPTRYVFQFLTDAAFQVNPPGERFVGAGEAPAGGAEIEGGSIGISVGVTLSGLSPATNYHFRIVASNHCVQAEPGKTCQVAGADETFNTFAGQVSDCPMVAPTS